MTSPRAPIPFPSDVPHHRESHAHRYSFPFTAVPNGFIEHWMPRLAPSASVVMLALYRMTLGWQRDEAAVSFPQLRTMTGISSYTTISQALNELIHAGLIIVKEERTAHNGKIYQLTAAAISSTESVKLPGHDSEPGFTESVKEPLQEVESSLYGNRRASFTKSVKQKSRDAVQDAARRESQERERKEKEIDKERRSKEGEEVEHPEDEDEPPPEDIEAMVERVAHQNALAAIRRDYQQAQETLRTAMPLSHNWIEAQRTVRHLEYSYPELMA